MDTIKYFNVFNTISEKAQNQIRAAAYNEMLANTLNTMMTYKLPNEQLKNVDQGFHELFLLINGMAALWKHPTDGWISSLANFTGEVDAYGMSHDLIVRALDGKTETFKDWKDNPDVIVFFNNSCKAPDMNIGRFSQALTDVEISLKLNVLYSRLFPIPVAKDQPTKKALNEIITNMLGGIVKDGPTIVDEDMISKLIEGSSGVDTINFTDIDKSRYIQYLAKYRDDLMRWFYSMYGMNSQGSSKLAQQTVDEVNQDNNASMIIPHDMLRCRQKALEIAKEKQPQLFEGAEVSFSECWMSRLANMDDEFKETDEELEEGPEEPGAPEEPEGGEGNEA